MLGLKSIHFSKRGHWSLIDIIDKIKFALNKNDYALGAYCWLLLKSIRLYKSQYTYNSKTIYL